MKLNVIVYVNGERVRYDELRAIEIRKPTVTRILSGAEKRITRQKGKG